MATIGDLLSHEMLRGARCLAGEAHLFDRQVQWFSIIEWPVEDFVQRGDLVMTTGIGCNAQRFCELMRQVVVSDPAAVCVSISDQGQLRDVPAAAAEVAEDAAIPLIELPWRIRFAEVARVVVDGPGTTDDKDGSTALEGLGPEFIAALLDERGMEGIVTIGEAQTGEPIVVLDGDLRVGAAGSKARAVLGDRLDICNAAAEGLPAADLLATRSALENAEAVGEGLARLGLPDGVVIPAGSVRRRGYVYVPEAPTNGIGGSLSVFRQVAEAAAVEQVRSRAIAEAAVRAEGDLLWAIARGDIVGRDDIDRRAALIGYRRGARHTVAVGILQSGPAASNDIVTLEAVTLPRLRRHGVHASRSDAYVLVLASGGQDLERLLADAPGAKWGIAHGTLALSDLHDAYVRARDTAAAASALGRPGRVNLEREVSPYLLLTRLRDDPAASRITAGLLAPLLDYDQRTSRGLTQTLEVYLEHSGNTSAAARALHLNRHSLMYRLRKIESLTGRELTRRADSFLLELALRVWRLEQTRGSQATRSP